jgi:hypothetical protein
MELTERLIFYPKTKVEFLRTKGIEMGTITNEIVEDSTGGIHLRFACSLERSEMRPGSPEEKEFAAGCTFHTRVAQAIVRRTVAPGFCQPRRNFCESTTRPRHPKPDSVYNSYAQTDFKELRLPPVESIMLGALKHLKGDL